MSLNAIRCSSPRSTRRSRGNGSVAGTSEYSGTRVRWGPRMRRRVRLRRPNSDACANPPVRRVDEAAADVLGRRALMDGPAQSLHDRVEPANQLDKQGTSPLGD